MGTAPLTFCAATQNPCRLGKVDPGDYTIEIVPPSELGATGPIRRSVSVLGGNVDGPVASFGLATGANILAFTGRSVDTVVRLALLMLLAGLAMASLRRRRNGENAPN